MIIYIVLAGTIIESRGKCCIILERARRLLENIGLFQSRQLQDHDLGGAGFPTNEKQ